MYVNKNNSFAMYTDLNFTPIIPITTTFFSANINNNLYICFSDSLNYLLCKFKFIGLISDAKIIPRGQFILLLYGYCVKQESQSGGFCWTINVCSWVTQAQQQFIIMIIIIIITECRAIRFRFND